MCDAGRSKQIPSLSVTNRLLLAVGLNLARSIYWQTGLHNVSDNGRYPMIVSSLTVAPGDAGPFRVRFDNCGSDTAHV